MLFDYVSIFFFTLINPPWIYCFFCVFVVVVVVVVVFEKKIFFFFDERSWDPVSCNKLHKIQ